MNQESLQQNNSNLQPPISPKSYVFLRRSKRCFKYIFLVLKFGSGLYLIFQGIYLITGAIPWVGKWPCREMGFGAPCGDILTIFHLTPPGVLISYGSFVLILGVFLIFWGIWAILGKSLALWIKLLGIILVCLVLLIMVFNLFF